MRANGFHEIDNPSHYIITTNLGFRVHSVNGGTLVKNCESIPDGLSLCQSYRNSQIFFVVGTGYGKNLDMPTNKLFLWNDELKILVAHLDFFGPIVDLKVAGEWILVAQKDKVALLNFGGNLADSEK